MSRTRVGIVAAALLASATVWAAPSAAHTGETDVREDLGVGDLVVQDGLTVEVGEPGTWTMAHQTLEQGDHRSLMTLTELDGTVLVASTPQGAEMTPVEELGLLDNLPQVGPSGSASSPAACDDSAYNLTKWTFSDGSRKSFKWKTTFSWFFKANSTPENVSVDEARAKVGEATGNITASRNDCGLADSVSATHTNAGDTTASPDFSASGEQCKKYGAKDGKSVVAFGTLPVGVLGAACTWGTWNGSDTYATANESDVRLNKASYDWYAATKPALCTNGSPVDSIVNTRVFSVEAVMTHERGHTFGLGHVAEATHGNLTMSTTINGACQESESSLGRGDVLALRALY